MTTLVLCGDRLCCQLLLAKAEVENAFGTNSAEGINSLRRLKLRMNCACINSLMELEKVKQFGNFFFNGERGSMKLPCHSLKDGDYLL